MSTLKFIFKSLLKQPRRRKRASGFTLIELLVALILTFLIITPLLSLVISFMTTDRQEQAKNSSQQEIQAALDYMAQDMQQAVYIYDATALSRGNNSTDPSKSGIQDQIPPSQDAPGCEDVDKCVPVLALWKRKYLDKNDVVDGKKIGEDINDGSKGSDRYVYSLVVYYLIKNDPSDSTWSKVARIGRFEIRDGILDPNTVGNTTPTYLLAPDSGFAPFDLSLAPGKIQQSMNSWVKDGDAYDQPVVTLVDYIDDTPVTDFEAVGITNFTPPTNDTEDDAGNMISTTAGQAVASSGCGDRTGQTVDTITGGFINGSSRVPPDEILTSATDLQTGSFYACVNPLNDQGQSVAQVFLRGNALPRLSKDENRWKITASNKTTQLANRPTASVRVAVRGLLSSDEE
jgi:type II secretory pathway pseudopilin PulG